MNVILHFPSDPESLKELKKKYARAKAGFILDQLEKSPMALEEKRQILNEILSQKRREPDP